MQALPPPLVELLDRLHLGERGEELVELWLSYRNPWVDELTLLFDISLSDQELELQGRFERLLEESDSCLSLVLEDEAEAETLFRLLAELCANGEAFEQGRNRRHFVAIPELDRLLCAGLATLRGRGGMEAVWSRLPPARRAVAALRATAEEVADLLPEPIQQAVSEGFDWTEKGFVTAQRYLQDEGTETLEQALLEWKSGGEILTELVDFLDQVRDQEEWERPATPILGEFFAAMENDFDEELQRLFFEERLPQFFDFWENAAVSMPVEPAVLEELFPVIDLLVQELGALEPWDEEGLLETLTRLEEGFAELRRRRLPLDRLYGSPFEPEVELLVGALNGEVPRLVLESARRTMAAADNPPLVQEIGQLLGDFLESEDNLLLLEALHRVNQEVSGDQTTVACPECGRSTSRFAKKCSHCGKGLPGLEISV